jgi:hypothetical protein
MPAIPAREDLVVIVVLDARRISFVAHRAGHGLTPILVRKLRTSRT